MCITNPSLKRRLRRSRATARFRWWLHKTGQYPLKVIELVRLKRVLASHHSRDLNFIKAIKSHIATMTAEPWRCATCLRLVKGTAEYCPGCGGFWSNVWDKTYHHPKPVDSRSSWSSWSDGWGGKDQRPKSPRRAPSPRRKGKGKGKEKGKAKEEPVAPPFSAGPSALSLPSPPALPAMIQNAAQSAQIASSPFQQAKKPLPTKEEQELQTLRMLAKTLKTQSGLGEEVMKALHASEEAMQKETTRSYRDLITALGNARKMLSDLDQEWEDYRLQWANYMDTVSRTWIEQAESFEQGESAFKTKRKEAIEKIQDLRSKLNAIHQKTMKSEQGAGLEQTEAEAEMAQTEDVEDADTTGEDARLEVLKTQMSSAVQVLKDSIEARVRHRERPRSRSQRRQDGKEDDVQIVEPIPKLPKTTPGGV